MLIVHCGHYIVISVIDKPIDKREVEFVYYIICGLIQNVLTLITLLRIWDIRGADHGEGVMLHVIVHVPVDKGTNRVHIACPRVHPMI